MPEFYTDGAVATLTLSRPAKLNALDRATLDAIARTAASLEPEVRVLILDAEGGDFSAGADLTPPSASGQAELLAALRANAEAGRRAVAALRAAGALTVAAVQGRAIGGGFVLAAACDLRIAAEDASFSLPEVDLGIPVGWGGVPVLAAELGPALARELILTCRAFPAAEALRAGFLTRMVPTAELGAAARELAATVAAKPPAAVRRSVQQLRAALPPPGAAWQADADLIALSVAERLAEGEGFGLRA